MERLEEILSLMKKRNLELLGEIARLRTELEEVRQGGIFLERGEDPRMYVSVRPESQSVIIVDPEMGEDGGVMVRHSLGRQAVNFARYLEGIPTIPYGPTSKPPPAPAPTTQGCVFTQ